MRRTIGEASLFCTLIMLSVEFVGGSCVKPVVLVVGTRPEGIKMAPLYYALKNESIPTILCSTGQHADLLDDVWALFDLKPDITLRVMRPGQDLFYLTETLLQKLQETFKSINPSLVVVQGDTTTAMVGALAAFYLKIPVAHLEAGLRTHSLYMPFPEEVNRRIVSVLAQFNFAPTKQAEQNLLNEGVEPKTIFCTGNTVVDALFMMRDRINSGQIPISDRISHVVEKVKKDGKTLIVLTAHRRESFGIGLEHIFNGVKKALAGNKHLYVIYPMHPNPAIKQSLDRVGLTAQDNIFITTPLDYADMIYLMVNADGIATDSGGIQEEGITLGKPVIVLRTETERGEGVAAGLAKLVGTDEDMIEREIQNFSCKRLEGSIHRPIYGDGTASTKIVEIIKSSHILVP